jgi:hypothetical protein
MCVCSRQIVNQSEQVSSLLQASGPDLNKITSCVYLLTLQHSLPFSWPPKKSKGPKEHTESNDIEHLAAFSLSAALQGLEHV